MFLRLIRYFAGLARLTSVLSFFGGGFLAVSAFFTDVALIEAEFTLERSCVRLKAALGV